MNNFYSSLRDRQMRMGIRIVMADETRKKQVLVEHRAIADAIAAGDPQAAVQAVREHLDTTLRSMKRPNI
jgi:DNA-binding FadR family transcriptional regulator